MKTDKNTFFLQRTRRARIALPARAHSGDSLRLFLLRRSRAIDPSQTKRNRRDRSPSAVLQQRLCLTLADLWRAKTARAATRLALALCRCGSFELAIRLRST